MANGFLLTFVFSFRTGAWENMGALLAINFSGRDKTSFQTCSSRPGGGRAGGSHHSLAFKLFVCLEVYWLKPTVAAVVFFCITDAPLLSLFLRALPLAHSSVDGAFQEYFVRGCNHGPIEPLSVFLG